MASGICQDCQQPFERGGTNPTLRCYPCAYELDRARQAVGYVARKAIKNGKLVRQPCEVCGSTYRIAAHHDDYSKPLDVRWLCPLHHRQHHARVRRDALTALEARQPL